AATCDRIVHHRAVETLLPVDDSLAAAAAGPRESARCERRREEKSVLVDAAAHVRQGQLRTRIAPPGAVDLLARSQPLRRLHPARPRRYRPFGSEPQDVADVVRHAAVALALV